MPKTSIKDRVKLRRTHPEVGFTLIELLIVIVILAILAAIVVFAVGTTGQNSAVAACKADAKSVETAIEAYKAQNNGSYPTSLDQLTAETGASGAPYLRAEPGTSHYVISLGTVTGTAGNLGHVLIGKAKASVGTSDFDTVATACEDNAS